MQKLGLAPFGNNYIYVLQGEDMKTLILCVISLVIGFTLAAVPSLMVFQTSGQNAFHTQNKIYSQVLEKVSSNETEELVELSCLALQIGIDRYDELDNSFLILNGPELNQELQQKEYLQAKSLVQNEELCGRT